MALAVVALQDNMRSVRDELASYPIIKFHNGLNGPNISFIPIDLAGCALELPLPDPSHDVAEFLLRRSIFPAREINNLNGSNFPILELSDCGRMIQILVAAAAWNIEDSDFLLQLSPVGSHGMDSNFRRGCC